MGNITGMFGGAAGGASALAETPTLKFSMREYEDIGLKVGDRVSLEFKKTQSSGI